MPRRLPLALLAALLVVAAVFYLADLTVAPAYATPDEVIIALEADSIHSSGRDRHGRAFPVYFEVTGLSWFQPMAIYAEAAVLGVAPFGIRTFRSTTVGIAILDGALAWCVLRAMLGPWSALVGTVVLLTAPAHFIHGRLAMDYLYPLPFVLGWLWSLLEFDKRGNWQWLFAAGTTLAAGFFTYSSAMALMPAFFVLTVGYLAVTARLSRAWWLCAGALPLFIWPAIWLSSHPEMIRDTFVRYSIGSPAAAGWVDKLNMYRENLDPVFLFSDAGGAALFSLRGWGLILPASGLLFGAGLFASLRTNIPRLLIVGGGLLVAAVPAVIVDERHAVQRLLPMLPFMAVIAAAGFDWLWRSGPSPAPAVVKAVGASLLAVGLVYLFVVLFLQSRIPGLAFPLVGVGAAALIAGFLPNAASLGRITAIVLIAAVLSQFSTFVVAYRTDYPVWSRILNGDLPGALTRIAQEASATNAPAIYLDAYIDRLDEYWEFTMRSAGRPVAAAKINYRPEDFAAEKIPAGSLVLVRLDDTHAVSPASMDGADRIAEIPERRGPVIYSIYRKR